MIFLFQMGDFQVPRWFWGKQFNHAALNKNSRNKLANSQLTFIIFHPLYSCLFSGSMKNWIYHYVSHENRLLLSIHQPANLKPETAENVDVWGTNHFPRKGLLVGGFNPFEKYESNLIISPNRGENKTCLKPPPSLESSNLNNQYQVLLSKPFWGF